MMIECTKEKPDKKAQVHAVEVVETLFVFPTRPSYNNFIQLKFVCKNCGIMTIKRVE